MSEVTLEDINRAMEKVPEPACYADYCKEYWILPGGEIEEIKPESQARRKAGM